ncbi:uncharacterized protein LOC103706023 isoform X2 [Phoenix dactylifera]|uniref:Uncharacterized protein LOC103706023 isoform X2 n=1 Tax=Phoenix dactylifera TaxID=42345 RepID=A0A8B8Z8P5_PHODC|nr:uncharacterized protein LOC103706023 isoform X2 [Phoenix dactylifera]
MHWTKTSSSGGLWWTTAKTPRGPLLTTSPCSGAWLFSQKSAILQPLRVMVLEDMAYIVHVKEFEEHISSSLTLQQQLVLLDLEQCPPEILPHTVENENASELRRAQKSFSSVFPVEVGASVLPVVPCPMVKPVIGSSKCEAVDVSCSSKHTAFQTSSALDLSYITEDAKIALSSVNGWLLGYPITYLFSKEHGEKAMRNLSFKSIYHYKLFARRKGTLTSKLQEDEVLSFTAPCDVAKRREEEPWIEAFLARMEGKLKRCSQVWVSMRLEVKFLESNSQIIVV